MFSNKIRFSMKKDNPSQKVVIMEEEMDNTDIDDVVNLEGLLGLVFVDK